MQSPFQTPIPLRGPLPSAFSQPSASATVPAAAAAQVELAATSAPRAANQLRAEGVPTAKALEFNAGMFCGSIGNLATSFASIGLSVTFLAVNHPLLTGAAVLSGIVMRFAGYSPVKSLTLVRDALPEWENDLFALSIKARTPAPMNVLLVKDQHFKHGTVITISSSPEQAALYVGTEAAKLPKNRRRFVLAHEIGHLQAQLSELINLMEGSQKIALALAATATLVSAVTAPAIAPIFATALLTGWGAAKFFKALYLRNLELKTDARGVALTEDPRAACEHFQADLKTEIPLERALFRKFPMLLPYPAHQTRIDSIAEMHGITVEHAPRIRNHPLDDASAGAVALEYVRRVTRYHLNEFKAYFKRFAAGDEAK